MERCKMKRNNVALHGDQFALIPIGICNRHSCGHILLKIILFCLLFSTHLPSQLAAGYNKFLGNLYGNSAPHPTFESLWNQVTPENHGKWIYNEPSLDIYEWEGLDEAYNYAITRDFQYKHHTLIYGASQGTPWWLQNLDSLGQAQQIEEWIQLVGSRYPETDLVDVVNHPILEPPSYINAMGGSGSTGWDWVIWAFQKARQYFSDSTKLLINEAAILNGDIDIYTYIEIINLLKADTLIDGIVCQGHYLENTDSSSIKARLNQLALTGLPIYIGGYDVDIADDAQQLAIYQEQFPVFWNHPAVQGVTLWGYIQGQIWSQNAYLLRADGTERPALQWLREYLTETKIGNKDIAGAIPEKYKLHQNFPNPFNPSTTIKYSLSRWSKVKVIIYNVKGEKVRTLVDSYQNTGEYSTIWDAKNNQNIPVSSGIYFYRLTSDDVSLQKKMILMR